MGAVRDRGIGRFTAARPVALCRWHARKLRCAVRSEFGTTAVKATRWPAAEGGTGLAAQQARQCLDREQLPRQVLSGPERTSRAKSVLWGWVFSRRERRQHGERGRGLGLA